MNDFTKDMANALFNQDKINDLFRQKLQQAVNDLLESELTAFLGYNPYECDGWNTGNSRNGAYYRKVYTNSDKYKSKFLETETVSFINTLCQIIKGILMF